MDVSSGGSVCVSGIVVSESSSSLNSDSVLGFSSGQVLRNAGRDVVVAASDLTRSRGSVRTVVRSSDRAVVRSSVSSRVRSGGGGRSAAVAVSTVGAGRVVGLATDLDSLTALRNGIVRTVDRDAERSLRVVVRIEGDRVTNVEDIRRTVDSKVVVLRDKSERLTSDTKGKCVGVLSKDHGVHAINRVRIQNSVVVRVIEIGSAGVRKEDRVDASTLVDRSQVFVGKSGVVGLSNQRNIQVTCSVVRLRRGDSKSREDTENVLSNH